VRVCESPLDTEIFTTLNMNNNNNRLYGTGFTLLQLELLRRRRCL